MFLIKAAFWLGVVIMFLPAEPGKDDRTTVGTGEAFHAASATMSDLRGFCGRNPSVCETGQAVLHTFEAKARYGARKLNEVVNGGDSIEPIPVQTETIVLDAADNTIVPQSRPTS